MTSPEKSAVSRAALWPRTVRAYQPGRVAPRLAERTVKPATQAPIGGEVPEPSPWHDGERALQARTGTVEKLALIGQQKIRNHMPDQHREFYAQLPFLLVASVDEAGWPWASLISGTAGFAHSPDPQRLDIAARPVEGDPLANALRLGQRLGILGIELPTRRRNRMNGHIVSVSDFSFSVAVDQSFGNCPQYIQRRDYAGQSAPAGAVQVESFTALDAAAKDLIRRADTFFVASAADHGLDISHRGGNPGFLGLEADYSISVPDYRGNHYFNTLGNLLVYPRAGLLFIDFAGGNLLQIAGAASILPDGVDVEGFPGAERIWRVAPSHGRWLHGALPQRFASA